MLIPFNQLFARHRVRVSEVLHVGANTGQEAEEYAKLGIRKVVWIEAHAPTYKKLVAHLAKDREMVESCCRCFTRIKNHSGYHVCLNACISDEDGKEVTFNVANNGCQSSSILEFGTHSKEHPTVKFVEQVKMKTRRLDTLLAEQGIEFNPGALLNMDLQGAEMLALLGMGDVLKNFDHLYLEVNERELYRGCTLVGKLDKWLQERGYVGRETKMTGSGWGDKLYSKMEVRVK